MSVRATIAAAACLCAFFVYTITSPANETAFFAPAPVATNPYTMPVAQAPMYMAPNPAMQWSEAPMAYPQPVYVEEPAMQQDGLSSSAWVLACFAFGSAAGYGARSMLAVGGADEPTDKEKTIGAAGLGGVLGVVLFGSLPGALVLAAAGAYATTKSDAVKSAGAAAAKVYSKAVELDEEYEVVPKAKSAIDTAVTVAGNLNENYGITAKIDEKLLLSERAESLTAKFDEQKSKLTSKVDELKEKASS